MARFHTDEPLHPRLKRLRKGTIRGANVLDHLRDVERAAVGNRGVREGELEHRDTGVALADGGVQRIADPERPVVLCVPLPGCEKTLRLAADPDPGALGEAKRLGEAIDALEADLLGELPEIDVARLHDRIVEVYPLVPLAAAEPLPSDLEKAHTFSALHRVDDRVLERGKRRDDLEGRAGEVRLVDRLVDQRTERIGRQLGVPSRAQAAAHLVRVVHRLRVQRANGTRVDVDHDRSAGGVGPKRAVERLHDAHVERQLDVVPGYRLSKHFDIERVGSIAAKRFATCVDDDPSETTRPAQELFVASLETVAADAVSGAIGLGIGRFPEVGLVHLVQVSNEVGAERAVRIVPKRSGDDVERRELREMCLQRCELIPIDVAIQLNLVRSPVLGKLGNPLLERCSLVLVESHQRRDALDILWLEQARRRVHVVGRPVRRDDSVFDVTNDSASCWKLQGLGDVLLRDPGPPVALKELNLRNPDDEAGENQHHEQRHPSISLPELSDFSSLRERDHAGARSVVGSILRASAKSSGATTAVAEADPRRARVSAVPLQDMPPGTNPRISSSSPPSASVRVNVRIISNGMPRNETRYPTSQAVKKPTTKTNAWMPKGFPVDRSYR